MARPGRLDGVDLARAVALLGMMLVHVVPTIDWQTGEPSVAGMLAGGRAAPLFALLAGLSLCLVRRRDPEGAGSTRAIVLRGAVLVVLGLLLGSLDSMPVLIILAFYGLMLVALVPFLHLSTRALGAVAGAWLLLAPPLHLVLLRLAGTDYREQLELSDLAHPGGLLVEATVTGTYPSSVWMGYVLAGAWLGRLPLQRAATAARLAAAGAVLLVASMLVGLVALRSGVLDGVVADRTWRSLFPSQWAVREVTDPARLLVVGEHTSSSLNVLAATGTAALVLGLCLLVMHVPAAPAALAPLTAAGSMTLSLYTIHVLWVWRENEGGWLVAEDRHVEWLVQGVVLVLLAWGWRRTWGRGPLERVVRAISLVGR